MTDHEYDRSWIARGLDPNDPVAERYEEAREALIATNPPSLDGPATLDILDAIAAAGADPIPSGEEILRRILDAES